MLVRDLTEDDLLAHIRPFLPQGRGILVPSGDDCAVLRFPDSRVAISTDMLVEGRHFRRDWSSGADIGWRAAMTNLADAVAMGARPASLVVSLSLPGDTPLSWMEDFARGLGEATRAGGAGVDGGDLVSADVVTIGVSILGDLEGRHPLLRSHARPGQIVVYSGALGHGAAGLALCEAGMGEKSRSGNEDTEICSSKLRPYIEDFLRPKPPLDMALYAARAGLISACMDVSDGLVCDARRMAKASQQWIDIDTHALAGDIAQLVEVGKILGESEPEAWARHAVLTGGEDHGFLATADEIPVGFGAIGTVHSLEEARVQGCDVSAGWCLTVDGQLYADTGGWDHFGG